MAICFCYSRKIASCQTQYPNKILQIRPMRKTGVKISYKKETIMVEKLHPLESKHVDIKVPNPGTKFSIKTIIPWQLESSKSKLFCKN